MKKGYIILICSMIFMSIMSMKSVQPTVIPINDGVYYNNVERVDDFEKLCELVEFHYCPLKYEKNITDCSEMSAYWEWYLENEGYHTLFIWTNHIFGDNHMWLLVETDIGYVALETSWEQHAIIKTENYFEGQTCEDIYEAIKVFGISEVDWWKL